MVSTLGVTKWAGDEEMLWAMGPLSKGTLSMASAAAPPKKRSAGL